MSNQQLFDELWSDWTAFVVKTSSGNLMQFAENHKHKQIILLAYKFYQEEEPKKSFSKYMMKACELYPVMHTKLYKALL